MLLSDADLRALTGYRRPSAQVRALRAMGVRHWVRPDGRPVVHESALSDAQSGGDVPDWSALDAETQATR